jgi:NAD(P)-dependent dehydrogenase (short-subunit alcohol dehydrogenase family)
MTIKRTSGTTADEVIQGLDLSGATAVVTGGAGGLGLETARALAAGGAHVVLGVRSDEKGQKATAEILAQHADALMSYGALDLANLDSVRGFASVTLERHPAIQILVNNAGVMCTPLGRTRDGFEMQFGTNHLGHFLLTVLLAPGLVRGGPSRVVTVGSGGHTLSDIIWDDPNYRTRAYDKFEAYGQSKTANILFTRELERRLANNGVHAFAVHPGIIATGLGRHMTDEDMRVLAGQIESSRVVPK